MCSTGGRCSGKMLWLAYAYTEMIASPPPALLVFGDGTVLGLWSKRVLEGIASCLLMLSYKVRWFPLPCGRSACFSCKAWLMESSSSRLNARKCGMCSSLPHPKRTGYFFKLVFLKHLSWCCAVWYINNKSEPGMSPCRVSYSLR